MMDKTAEQELASALLSVFAADESGVSIARLAASRAAHRSYVQEQQEEQ